MSEKDFKIAIIDVDLLERKKHRFPNLACEKISGYWKAQGASVELELDYEDYLPCEIEYHMPDYHLYDDFFNFHIEAAVALQETEDDKESTYKHMRNEFKEFLDYSIGFVTRGCFRKCGFCVNKKYYSVFEHSSLSEFYDPSRPKICFILESSINPNDLAKFYTLFVDELRKRNEEEKIGDKDLAFLVAQEYANSGFLTIQSWLDNQNIKDDEAVLWDLIAELDDKFIECFHDVD